MKKHCTTGLLFVLLTIQAQAQLNNQGSDVIITSGTFVQILGNVINANGGSLTVEGTLSTPDNLTNTSSATLQGNGQYHIGGDWMNEATFSSGTSTVTFDGNQNSTVTAGDAAFYDVALNKTGGNDLLLAGNMTVNNTLDFKAADNYAVLGEYNLQVVDIISYDAVRHVRTTGSGFLVRTVGASPVVFPVGSTSYNPATLTNAGTSDQYRVRVANDVLSGGYTGNGYLTDALDRSWFVEEATPGGSDLTLTLQWSDSEELPGFDRSMAYVSHFDAGTWDNQPTAAADGTGPYTLSRTGITVLSPFAVLGGNFQPTVDILGQILWKGDGFTGVKDAIVTASGDLDGMAITDIAGNYTLTLAGNGDVSLVPTKNVNLFNGINMGDALAIQKHLVGISVITDFFRLVAADCNNNFSISTIDAAIIWQALLGNPSAVAIMTATGSWRFISTDYPYPDPAPPYILPNYTPYKMRSATVTASNMPDQDFWGIKTGDVVAAFADPSNFGGGGMQPLVFRVQDRMLEAGQELDVTFSADHLTSLAALQFGLHFNPDALELQEVEPLTALPLSADNFGLFEVQQGAIRAAWSQMQDLELPGGSEVFRLHFSALTSGVHLSEVLDMEESILPGLAFNSALQQAPVALHFDEVTATGTPAEETVQDFEVSPNPFVHTTNVRFNLPEACRAQLRVLDESGHELWRSDKAYPAGRQQETIRLAGIVGALVCELTTPWGTQSLKVVGVE